MTEKRQYMRDRQDNKKKFQQEENSSKRVHRAVTVVVILLLAATVLYTLFRGADRGSDAGKMVASSGSGQDIKIPISEISGGQARFYRYTLPNSQEVRFFAIKSSDGVVRAALDACIVCFKARRGYRQEGDDLVCNNCNRHFRSVDVNVITGGCNPIPLTRSVEAEALVIKPGSLQQGAIYF